jgi:hypothetical protein
MRMFYFLGREMNGIRQHFNVNARFEMPAQSGRPVFERDSRKQARDKLVTRVFLYRPIKFVFTSTRTYVSFTNDLHKQTGWWLRSRS